MVEGLILGLAVGLVGVLIQESRILSMKMYAVNGRASIRKGEGGRWRWFIGKNDEIFMSCFPRSFRSHSDALHDLRSRFPTISCR